VELEFAFAWFPRNPRLRNPRNRLHLHGGEGVTAEAYRLGRGCKPQMVLLIARSERATVHGYTDDSTSRL
jgi:hypothetical protein